MGFGRALAAVAVLGSISSVYAQTTNAICLPRFAPLNNDRGQSPCLVAAYMQQPCVTDGSNWNVPALTPGLSYVGPRASQATFCSCSSVVYSLVSACAACQNTTWIPWSNWIGNCTQQTTTLGTYPLDIPAGTSVPAWAYGNVALLDSFNRTAAAVDTAPESTYYGTPTASINYHLTSQSASLTVSIDPTATQSQSPEPVIGGGGSKTNVGAIVGGVIGGIVVIALIAVLVWLLMKRNNSNKDQVAEPDAYFNGDQQPITQNQNGANYGVTYPTSPTLFSESSQPTTMQKLYDPSDPSTFPQTPASFGYQSTTGDGMSQSANMSHGMTTTTGGRYTGAAEV